MSIPPVVRYMILCDNWYLDVTNSRRIIIEGLLSNIKPLDYPPYPLLYAELCVFLVLTEGRSQADGHIVCVDETTGQEIFRTRKRSIQFGSDPLELVGVPFRIRDCMFPKPGMYNIQFWYDDRCLEERSLRLR